MTSLASRRNKPMTPSNPNPFVSSSESLSQTLSAIVEPVRLNNRSSDTSTRQDATENTRNNYRASSDSLKECIRPKDETTAPIITKLLHKSSSLSTLEHFLSDSARNNIVNNCTSRTLSYNSNCSFLFSNKYSKTCVENGYIKTCSNGGDSGRESLIHPTEPSRNDDDASSSESEEEELVLSSRLSDKVSSNDKRAYFTAKEIATSERVFVDCLRLICVDFRVAVTKESTDIPHEELNQILSYLPHLQHLNEEFLFDFEFRLCHWLQKPKIADVFLRKGPFLKLYSAYIRDFQNQSTLLDECVQKYPRFASALKEFEMSERCKRLPLTHYIIKPIQRLPQYRLLLEAYLRQLNESSIDYNDAVAALKVVSEVADHANDCLKQGDDFKRLLDLQSRLGDWEIIKPGRQIIKEGELTKISRKTQAQPRYFILFNDCLLYTSYINTCNLKLLHELSLLGMEIHDTALEVDDGGSNQFNLISTTRSFTLSAESIEVRDEWLLVIGAAINQFNRNPRLANVTEIRLGQQAPVFVPFKKVNKCQLCFNGFTIACHRNHCNACGRVVCRNCASNKAKLEYKKLLLVRVCDECFRKITDDGNSDESSTIITKGDESSTNEVSRECSFIKDESNSNQSQRRNVLIFLGTSCCCLVSRYVARTLEQKGLSVKIFDPLEMTLSVMQQPSAWISIDEANQEIQEADGFVIVLSSAKYRYGVHPAITNMMKHFPSSSYRHRPCSIVTYFTERDHQESFELKATTLILPIINELGMLALPTRVNLSMESSSSLFDSDGQPNDAAGFQESVSQMADELLWYVEALTEKRSISVPPHQSPR